MRKGTLKVVVYIMIGSMLLTTFVGAISSMF